ncbi:class I SAM-dependent methyltransferase [Oceanobacillus profundus]|uniref:Class I SAM-dependent methyltransferase n=1 Tax=Oceanobacillus profundus TaxID=372463 RepID=A0A417YIM2_9BACI|nr:class I SAM-dependent methyltransferase [Oceanobacillus profundus]MCM3400140.1 class I SAM-dependent methyltransferase [Oceanobacillus profundus]MDO6449853.1 class I SAM-dependent methyltransferase [Oceanobacillus profundus]RHW32699.1 class I SAM-dependent methyltransferase [Oceanobacillus profundus]
MIDYKFDKLLHVRTGPEKKLSFPDSIQYNPYEPTPYHALEILFQQYEVSEQDHFVDYGCGKGRLNFYIHHFYRASVKGIEMDENFYQESIVNLRKYLQHTNNRKDTIEFICCLAEEYIIDPMDNRFYFFNPFSVQIFQKVINRILRSIEESNREVELILYYAHEDYVYFLEDKTIFELKQEIQLPGLYEANPYERFLIYRAGN